MSNNANTNKAPNGASNGNKREPMVMLKLSYPQYRAVVKALKCANKGDQATLEAINSQLRGLGNVIAKRFPNGFKYPTNANNGNNAPAANNGNNDPANNNDVAGGAKAKKAKKSPAKRSKSPAKKAKKSPAKKAKKSPAKKAKKSPAKKDTRGRSKTPKRSKSPAKRSKSPKKAKKATKAKRH